MWLVATRLDSVDGEHFYHLYSVSGVNKYEAGGSLCEVLSQHEQLPTEQV